MKTLYEKIQIVNKDFRKNVVKKKKFDRTLYKEFYL